MVWQPLRWRACGPPASRRQYHDANTRMLVTQSAAADRSRHQWRDRVPGKGADKQVKRPQHGRRDHHQEDITDPLVEVKGAPRAGGDERDQNHRHHRQQKPGGAKGQRFGQRQMQAADGQKGNGCRPARLRWGHLVWREVGSCGSSLFLEPADVILSRWVADIIHAP